MLTYAVMVKAELNSHELLVIFRPRLLRREAESLVRRRVEEVGGKVEETDYWGERKLAYEIDHEERGIYALFFVELPREAVVTLKQNLHMEQKIMRIIMVRRR